MQSVFYRDPGSTYPTAVSASGMYIHDADGNQYLDMSGRAVVSSVGHARVGFENNMALPGGRVAGGNDDLVRLATQVGVNTGRSPATANDVRALFA